MNKYIKMAKKLYSWCCPSVREVELNLAAFFFALGGIYFVAYCACLLVWVGLWKFEIWVNFKGTGSIFLFCKPVWDYFLILYISVYLAQQNRCTYVGCGESHVDHSTTHSQVCVFAGNTVSWSTEVELESFCFSEVNNLC